MNEIESKSAESPNPYRAPVHSESVTSAGDDFWSEGVHTALRQTRPWVMFLGILGFVGTGIVLLVGVSMTFLAASATGGATPMMAGGAVYAVMALIYIPPSLFLVRYANRIRDFLIAPTSTGLETALLAQKSFWKFVGMLSAVVMVLYAVGIAFAVFVWMIRMAG